jgi:lipopolysaccharide transport system permease protein
MSSNEIVYTPDSQLRHPVKLLRGMARDLHAARELAWRLFVRDTAAQYRKTMLGYFWAVFPPLVTSLVFILLNSSNVVKVEKTDIPYPAYVVMGTVFFGLFVDAINAPIKLVNASKVMLARINFPREALLLSSVGQVLFSFAIKLLLLIVTLAYYNVAISYAAVLAIIPLGGILLLGTMVGILLVPPSLLYEDIFYGLSVVTTGLMFISPVAYPPPREGILATIMNLNPITSLLMSARDLVLVGFGPYTSVSLLVILGTLVLLFVGWLLFRIGLPILIERVGA